MALCTVVWRCFKRRSSSGSNASLIRSRQYLHEPKQINNSNIVAMTKFDSISCLPPGRALWIHVRTLRSRWHNSCRPKWVRYFLTQMFVPDDLVDVPKGELVCVWLLEVVPSPFQLLWKAVLFHTLCVLLVHPSSLTSPQYQYNYQNCQNMKLSSWWWILFFPKSSRNLRGFHKKMSFRDRNHGFPLRTAVV